MLKLDYAERYNIEEEIEEEEKIVQAPKLELFLWPCDDLWNSRRI